MRISVSGTSWVETPPELGVLALTVSAELRDRRAAFDAARTAAEAIVAAVEREKVSAEEDGVSRLTVSPVSINTWRPHSETGELLPEVHNATAQLSVAFREVERLARFAGEVGRAPHVRLGGISWELTDETAARVTDEQTAAAVVEALRRAQVVATAAGAGEVRVLEVSDPGLLTPAPHAEEFAMKSMARAAFDGAGESLDPEFLQVVPHPVRTEVTIQMRCEA